MKKAGIFALAVFMFMAVSGIASSEPALTVYNQDFAVVRDNIDLDLNKGTNIVRYQGITAQLEPDSVMLRDPALKNKFRILEQNYRAEPVSRQLLLSLYEGKTIDFLFGDKVVQGKIVRSGYVPHWTAMGQYGENYYNSREGGNGQPIIEVNGKLQFELPGIPLFPALMDDSILKPSIIWAIDSDKASKFRAELCYVTGGLNWEANYNFIEPEKGDSLDLVGWVTVDNRSGKTFDNAKIKLMAGDVNKIRPRGKYRGDFDSCDISDNVSSFVNKPAVTEKGFDEYHLYDFDRTTTLHDRETKQIEFINASGIKSQKIYVYDGVKIDSQRYEGYDLMILLQAREYGLQYSTKVLAMREFINCKENNLGMPLPKGRVRFYHRDSDGQLEFVGEDLIDHTPSNETVRVHMGNSFDLAGERKRTNYTLNTDENWLDESFEIKLRNHKKEPVEITVVEHLYRCNTWEIKEKSQDFVKKDSSTIEFNVQVPSEKEQTLTYAVHYTW
jgi:hypothetical protein